MNIEEKTITPPAENRPPRRELAPEETAADRRIRMKAALKKAQAFSELYVLMEDVEVEIRELPIGERNEIVRSLTEFSETKDGRKALKRFGITQADYQNVGLLIECVFVPGTDERFWTSRREIPEILELGAKLYQPFQRRVFQIQGIAVGEEVEEKPDVTKDPEISEEEKNS